jgi:hypothetical protein
MRCGNWIATAALAFARSKHQDSRGPSAGRFLDHFCPRLHPQIGFLDVTAQEEISVLDLVGRRLVDQVGTIPGGDENRIRTRLSSRTRPSMTGRAHTRPAGYRDFVAYSRSQAVGNALFAGVRLGVRDNDRGAAFGHPAPSLDSPSVEHRTICNRTLRRGQPC